jgi:N-acetylglucosaminyl-diphospho-decaprenol L-rhamnosyltransferase
MSSVRSQPRVSLATPRPERRHTSPPDVTVCIANWNCRELLRDCLKSLHHQPQGVQVETVVVDNGSTDGAAEMVDRDFPEVRLVRNERNAGFAAANNQAADLARGRYLFFLNNDTVVPAYTLRRLVTFAETHPEVGMIGPRLRDARGALQISYRRRPTVGALLHRTMLLRWTGLLRDTYRRYRRGDFDPKAQRCVDVLMGAAVMLPQEVFFECGRWDEAFAFGGEDIDLSTRIGRRHAVVYLPQIEITHHGRVSSRLNVTFAEPNVQVGYVRFLRKAGAGRGALVAYKLVVTCDARGGDSRADRRRRKKAGWRCGGSRRFSPAACSLSGGPDRFATLRRSVNASSKR